MELYSRTFLSFDEDIKVQIRKGGWIAGLGLMCLGLALSSVSPFSIILSGFGIGLILFTQTMF